MMYKILKQCCSKIVKDNRILKFTFTLIAIALIVHSFYIYLVVKPTYISNGERNMRPADFPEVLICPEPAVDINALKAKGYLEHRYYFKGLGQDLKSLQQPGWAGNNSDKVQKVTRDISILKSEKDCPIGRLTFENSTRAVGAKFILAKALYPYHICCKVVVPKVSKYSRIISMEFSVNSSYPYLSFKTILADQMTSSSFFQQKTMLGDKVVSMDQGHREYQVKISEGENLEGDPTYPCISYNIVGMYAKCVEIEMVQQNSQFLTCTPPWMTSNEDSWCKGGYELTSRSIGLSYVKFLNDIRYSEANSGQCLVPCKVRSYVAKEIGVRAENDTGGLSIRFEKEVDITKSSWTTTLLTLMSKVGGFVGLCKNFLWLTTILISSISVLMSNIKHRYLKQI